LAETVEVEATPRPESSGLLFYCITEASSPLPEAGRGVHGGELRRVAHGGLVAVVSSITAPERLAAPTTAELLDYERVIRSHHAVADVVPMRFGSMLADEAAVRAHLDEQQAVYLRALRRVAGCVELGVRLLVSSPGSPAAPEELPKQEPRSGASYLKALQRRYSAESRLRDHCAALEQALVSKVAPLCKEHRMELSPVRPGEPALCSLYFLVPRGQVSLFHAALSADAAGESTPTAVSGPWPPFNFVD
jgi:hypothetical protein